MLKRLTDFPDSVTLVPNTGLQMLDFGLTSSVVARLSRAFWPEIRSGETDEDGRSRVILHPLEPHENGFLYRDQTYPNGRMAPAEAVNTYRAVPALDVFDGEWLPAPVLRLRTGGINGRQSYDQGPVGWARIRVARLAEPDETGHTHRITLAIDTTLGETRRQPTPATTPASAAPAAAPYLAPEQRDATDPVEFQFVSDPTDILFFLEALPIRRWLKDRFLACLGRARKRQVSEDDIDPGEYWAQYILLLEAVTQACSVPRLSLIDTVSSPETIRPVDVDLVIDVGNSRTCGILIEKSRNDHQINIGQAIRLELRDLSRPEFAYAEPFATWVEFSPAHFGSYAHARRASQPNAFWWPSLVRIGPEAAWLAAQSDGTEGISGLSSPKRYLWDTAAREQPWANTRGLTPPGERLPEIRGPMTAQLTENGELVGAGRTVGTSPRYSRSSLYTLMLVELLSHALMQINSPALRRERTDRDVPRRLSTLILTLPSATPLAEQRWLRRRADDAWALLTRVMRWTENDPLHTRPTVRLDWDEATCTHLVYLHNEINHKYKGQPRDFFSLAGEGRRGPANQPALRIASIDMGGGTTDLMIIEHEVEGERIVHPHQLFREGFRLAGDDIVKTVIEHMIFPRLADQMRACGVQDPVGLLADLFGGDREGIAQQERALRATFATQILVPLALDLLAAYEATDGRRSAGETQMRVGDLLTGLRSPQPHVRAYLETAAQRRGGTGFALADVTLPMVPHQTAGVIASVIGPMLDDLCDIVRHYQCDLLLLSGRPSRLPIVRDRIYTNMPLPPSRVIAMHKYAVFNWYPFRSSNYCITDPKTTAVVGAVLCMICEGRTHGFFMRSSELRMRSTARYLGIMDERGQIIERNTLLHNVDFDKGAGMVDFSLNMEGPTFLGYRQLPLVRWRTTPLYHLGFRNPDRLARLRLPIRVTLERATLEEGADEAGLEEFKVVEAIDRDGTGCRNDIAFRLQTLRIEPPSASGYWLDTGIFSPPLR